MIKKYLILFFLGYFLFSSESFATLYRGAEITYTNIGFNTYGITVSTCTKTSSPADRPYLEIEWGDGTVDSILRYQIIPSGNGYDGEQNLYYGEHTFPGPGTYDIFLFEANRIQGIINIPGSVNEPIAVSSTLVISPFWSPNNSVQFSDFPCPVYGCIGQPFCYLPSVTDPDNDSLSFELVACSGDEGDPIGGYTFPNQHGGVLTLDSLTGEICWNSPVIAGDYNIALKIHEWRKLPTDQYVEAGSVIRDMQITIYPSCTMGDDEISEDSGISIYPNPFTSDFVLSSDQSSEFSFEILNSIGENICNGSFSQSARINSANWSNGIYFIRIWDEENSWCKKLVK